MQAQSKEQFQKAWESHRKEFAVLVNQIDSNDPLWDDLYNWYNMGRNLVKRAADHVYPGEES